MPAAEFTLPAGVTGFSAGIKPSEESFSRFKSACYEAARRINGRARGFTAAGVTPNFHQATLTFENEQIIIVCHAAFRFVAFARVSDEAKLQFLDHDDLVRYFKIQGYTVLDSATLSNALSSANMANLDESEADQIKYWRCKTVGEAIFNWFD